MVMCSWSLIKFFINQEYLPIVNLLKENNDLNPKKPLSALKNVARTFPFVASFNVLVFVLASISAFNNDSTSGTTELDIRSCHQWQTNAITITLAWLNLVFYIRLVHGIGQYIMIFEDVLKTFMTVLTVILILVFGFAFGFHMLLSHQDQFETPWDAMLKTLVMMSGELDYGDFFFKDIQPQGWGDQFDLGHMSVPFPVLTYTMFVVFFLLVSLVALNVLVGLTVADINNFLENADLRNLSMRIEYILKLERHAFQRLKKKDRVNFQPVIKKPAHWMRSVINNLISKKKIWAIIEKKQENGRIRGEIEREKKELKEEHSKTRKLLKTLIKKKKMKSSANSVKSGSRNRGRPSVMTNRSNMSSFSDDERDRNTELKMLRREIENLREIVSDLQDINWHLRKEKNPNKPDSSRPRKVTRQFSFY
jgi:transient receptor potential cation channel subfamily A protein 1